MTVAQRRLATGCLPPVVIDDVVDDPESIRALARARAPHSFPDRPGGLVWPTWNDHWSQHGTVLVEETAPLFAHQRFVAAAAEMSGTDRIVPQSVVVNLSTPSGAQPVSHTDLPEFHGVDMTDAPGWFLQAMGTSRLFEEERINAITAVSWFFAGDHGFFRYWPGGRGEDSVCHEAMWNTAVVGDNDFMHHKVERIGPPDMKPPAAMTSAAVLDHDGDEWIVVDDGRVIARYDDDLVRLSLSWTARVDQPYAGPDLTLDEVHARMAGAIGPEFVAASTDDLFSEPTYQQLVGRWPGYLPG